jgi:hypothetical protein
MCGGTLIGQVQVDRAQYQNCDGKLFIENGQCIGLKLGYRGNELSRQILPQARPANAEPSDIIVSLRIKLELLSIFQCIYTRLPDLKRSTKEVTNKLEKRNNFIRKHQ